MNERLQQAYDEFLGLTREIYYLASAQGVLEWDQQVMMPPRATPLRAAQGATLTGIVHDRMTAQRMADLMAELDAAGDALDADARVNVREMRRVAERARKIPRELAQEITRTQAIAQQEWVEARRASDFARFAPWLEKMLGLRRREADAVGYTETRYDALLDEYEPHTTTREIDAIFRALRPPIVEIARGIAESGVTPKRELLTRLFPVERQREFGLWAIGRFGFDFSAGRVDVSAHPMTTGNLTDVRLTTRYHERRFAEAFFGLAHEAGHGMYEQGFDERHQGTPRASAASLGIHESQSRMWENLVARSRPFWEYAFPFLQAFFPEASAGIDPDDWYAAVNDVHPSLIRVEADEVTYNLHIILRFEIEQGLVDESVKVADLPALWNAKMKELNLMRRPRIASAVRRLTGPRPWVSALLFDQSRPNPGPKLAAGRWGRG